MNLAELKTLLEPYSTHFYSMQSKKGLTFIGNSYCLVSTKLISDSEKKKLKPLGDGQLVLESFLKSRYKKLGITNKQAAIAALKKRNVKGIYAKTYIRVKTESGLYSVNSMLKLGANICIDSMYKKIFSTHTFWYHPEDLIVYAINTSTGVIEGLISRLGSKYLTKEVC